MTLEYRSKSQSKIFLVDDDVELIMDVKATGKPVKRQSIRYRNRFHRQKACFMRGASPSFAERRTAPARTDFRINIMRILLLFVAGPARRCLRSGQIQSNLRS